MMRCGPAVRGYAEGSVHGKYRPRLEGTFDLLGGHVFAKPFEWRQGVPPQSFGLISHTEATAGRVGHLQSVMKPKRRCVKKHQSSVPGKHRRKASFDGCVVAFVIMAINKRNRPGRCNQPGRFSIHSSLLRFPVLQRLCSSV